MTNDDDDADEEDHPLFERVKANSFFFIGSLLYLPVSIWDLVAVDGNSSKPPVEYLSYNIILVAATVAYLANGLYETRTAYRASLKLKLKQTTTITNETSASSRKPQKTGRKDILNGLLFTIAATFELSYVLAGRTSILLLSLSAHCYIANALLTLWIRRKADIRLSLPARMIRAGDILFLVGAGMDTTGTYLEAANLLSQPAALWVVSSAAWFIDAVLYLLADKISLDEEQQQQQQSSSSQPMITTSTRTGEEESELVVAEERTTTTPKKLSDIV
jgi:hypothetical protein